MIPTNREELIDYCLQQLGEPLIQVNVTPEQIENRVDTAIKKMQEYHYDGSERIIFAHTITASVIRFASAVTGTFADNEIITGTTSGAKARIINKATDNLSVQVRYVTGTFQDNEAFTTDTSNLTGTLAASNAVTIGDMDNGYITLPNRILSVHRIAAEQTMKGNIFDVNYQFALTAFPRLLGLDLVSYHMYQQHIALLQFTFNGMKPLEHKRTANKLTVMTNWQQFTPGQTICFECTATLDPADYPRFYEEEFLLKYTTAQLKYQWGQNLIKYNNIELPGGNTLNGAGILQEAKEEIAQLEEDLKKKYQLPCMFIMG